MLPAFCRKSRPPVFGRKNTLPRARRFRIAAAIRGDFLAIATTLGSGGAVNSPHPARAAGTPVAHLPRPGGVFSFRVAKACRLALCLPTGPLRPQDRPTLFRAGACPRPRQTGTMDGLPHRRRRLRQGLNLGAALSRTCPDRTSRPTSCRHARSRARAARPFPFPPASNRECRSAIAVRPATIPVRSAPARWPR